MDFYEFFAPTFNLDNIGVHCCCYNYTCNLFPEVEERRHLRLFKSNTLKEQTFAGKSFSISRFLENFAKVCSTNPISICHL